MRATVMHAAGDVRVEHVPDPAIEEPTDAVIRVTSACICGSDLWPYRTLRPDDGARVMGHEGSRRRCGSRTPTGRSTSCRSARTTR